jgi:hypothetical protein
MVVEHYTAGPEPVYERAATQGRMLPDGLEYMDSWVVDDDRMDRCSSRLDITWPSPDVGDH